MIENLANVFTKYGYEETISLNVDRLKQSIDQIATISDDEIENIVRFRIEQLKKSGFSLEDLNFYFWENDKLHTYQVDGNTLAKTEIRPFETFEQLEEHYIDRLKQQINTLRKVNKRLDVISKIEYNPNNQTEQNTWKNGQWLQMIKGQDPIEWAKENGKKIGGLDPDEYVSRISQEEEEETTTLKIGII